MSLSSGRYQLANAFKALKLEWESTTNVWRDVVRQDLAETHWDPLMARMSALLTAVDQLDQSLGQMRQDCGD